MAKQDRLPTQLRELKRKFKTGYKLERTGGGHYRVIDRAGRFVEHNGRNLTMSGNPSPGVVRALEEQLTEAHVLRGTDPAPRPRRDSDRIKRDMRGVEAERRERSEAIQGLQRRLGDLLEVVGGLEMPGLLSDLGHIGALVAREQGRSDMTPDLVTANAYRLAKGMMIDPRYFEVWSELAERLDRAPDTGGAWYALVREARGLPLDRVEVRSAAAGEEWPFRVELLSLRALLSDPAYQRPVNWAFVRGAAARFDPSLVGTIDVAQRSPSEYAILDGQQRTEMVRLVGLETVWASIYRGLDAASEARFFLHKNKDRRNVHPYYTFRARVAAEEATAVTIDRIVRDHGYNIAIGAPGDGRSTNIAAIAALERAFGRNRPEGGETALIPTLEVLRQSTLGRRAGQSAAMLGGLSLLLAMFTDEEMDRERLVSMITTLGSELLVGRAHDARRGGAKGTIDTVVARVLTTEYDQRAERGGRLPKALGRERVA